ncbi:ATP-binding cassette domain-containing protein [Bacillus sp. OHL2]
MIALTKPTYLFLDEISNGLDYGTMMELKAMIKKWSKDMTIIATGHQFEFYSSIVDELFILKDKSMIQIHDFQEKGEDLGDIYQTYL